MKINVGIIFLGILIVGVTKDALAFTTEELVNIKKAGVSEEAIVSMVEHDYRDADKVLRLKEAGFKDASILAIIKSEIRNQSAEKKSEALRDSFPAQVDFKTSARIKIVWYRIFHNKPLIQNKETIDGAQIAIAGETIQMTWPKKWSASPLNAFQKEPFESPFYWELNENDLLEADEEGYSYNLRTGPEHKGKPEMNSSHYWVVYLEPENSRLIEYIKSSLVNK